MGSGIAQKMEAVSLSTREIKKILGPAVALNSFDSTIYSLHDWNDLSWTRPWPLASPCIRETVALA